MRYVFAGLLFSLMLSLVTAAPVPKQPPPKPPELTGELLVGTWHYEWASMLDGIITFNSNGEYVGIHDLTGSVVYHGTYRVDGMTVTLTEFGYDSIRDTHWGPTKYVFDFAGSKLPELKGASNGDTPVKLTNPKK